MKPITEQVVSHVQDIIVLDPWLPRPEFRPASVAEVRSSRGFPVTNYQSLVHKVAELAHKNSGYNLLFRGQGRDHRNRNEASIAYPSIFRPGENRKSLRKPTIVERFESLYKWISILRQENVDRSPHQESQAALLQHYEICPTPLIDLSHSLRVAATFALLKSAVGYMYVFGLPHPHGSISHFVDDDITMVKLQSVSPAAALRPHYQEAFLVGRLSWTYEKTAGDNLARRLVGKYRLDNSTGSFWSKDFTPIPENALLPAVDAFRERLDELKVKHGLA